MNYFTEIVGLPWIIGFLVIVIEFFGSIALVVGIGTRIIAASYIILAFGIMFTSHVQHGFFINWYGNQAGEGFEYFILWIAVSIALLDKRRRQILSGQVARKNKCGLMEKI